LTNFGRYPSINQDVTFPEVNPIFLAEYTYNEDDNLVEYQSRTIEAIMGNYISTKLIYSYDQNGKLIEYNFYINSSDTLFNSLNVKYNYEDTILTSVILKDFSPSGFLNFLDSTSINYDTELRISISEKYRTVDHSYFEPIHHKEFIYNDEGHISEVVGFYNIDHDTNEWRRKERIKYHYTPNDDLLRISINDSDPPFEFDEQIYQTSFEYDEDIRADNIKMPMSRPTLNYSEEPSRNINHMLTEELNLYDSYLSGIELDYKISYYYSQMTTSINQSHLDNKTVAVFPNPTSDFISLNISECFEPVEVTIFDYSGRSVINTNLISGDVIDISELLPGNYLCQIKLESEFFIRPFSKLR